MFEPIRVPTATPVLFRAAKIATASSGTEVPIAAKVVPTTADGIPRSTAILAADSTTLAEANIARPSPIINITKYVAVVQFISNPVSVRMSSIISNSSVRILSRC